MVQNCGGCMMQSLWKTLRVARNQFSVGSIKRSLFQCPPNCISQSSVQWGNNFDCQAHSFSTYYKGIPEVPHFSSSHGPSMFKGAMVGPNFTKRWLTTVNSEESSSPDGSTVIPDVTVPPRIKFKRLDKTARNIMKILDKEAVEGVKAHREIPDIQPGYIIQLRVEVPENKRRVSTLKGIVIARRNAGLHSTFRVRRLVAGVGVESVFPLYSPNIKEVKVLEKKSVRRAKLYYLRDRMNALKKH